MNNVLETNGVPLTVFGGAVPELAPEDLPEGASPWNQDVDYNPGSVFTRGGRVNQIVYSALAQARNTTFAANFLDQANEVAWLTPSNAQSGVIGTDATVALQVPTPLDVTATGQGVYTTGQVASGTTYSFTSSPYAYNQLFGWINAGGAAGINPQGNPGWGQSGGPSSNAGEWSYQASSGVFQVPPSTTISGTFTTGAPPLVATIGALRTNGTTPNKLQSRGTNGVAPITLGALFNPLSAGTMIFVGVGWNVTTANAPVTAVATDNLGNFYQLLAFSQVQQGSSYAGDALFVCSNPTAGTQPNVTINVLTATGTSVTGGNLTGTAAEQQNYIATQVGSLSEQLQCTNYGFSIPPNTTLLGMQVLVQGRQTSSDPGATVTVQLMPGIASSPVAITQQLTVGSGEGTTTFGNYASTWGLPKLTPAIINNQSFGVQIQAASSSATCLFYISSVKINLLVAPSPSCNFNYIKTYEQTDGEVDTIALDANGVLWDEDVDSNPGNLTGIFTGILPNTFAKSVTFQDIEYIAFSNLLQGTDVPRQWNGSNLDRISMVGPGAAPSAAVAGGSGGSNNTAIATIKQNAPVEIRRLVIGTVNAPGDSTPGNLLLVFGEGRTGSNTYQSLAPYTNLFGAGTTVQLQNVTNPFPLKGGGSLPYNLNGYYTVGQVTTGIVGGAESCPIFTLPAPLTTWAYSADYGSGGPPPTSGWYYQSCLATVTLQAPLPNVGVGSQIQITGTGGSPPTGYDGTWTVLQAPNASSMTINSATVSAGVATYSFTLAANSSAPTVGQFVTVVNCLNGSGLGSVNVFNVSNAAISAVTGGSFSVSVNSVDIPQQNQVGGVPQAAATVGGTVFVFDAGKIVPSYTPTNAQIVGQGQVGVGVRKVAYSFLTRSGFITQPSPIYTFNVTSGSGAITVSGLSPGPSNVVGRIVMFTGANGGNFFYMPTQVTVNVGGVNIVNGGVTPNTVGTIVNDNTSTTATFSFSDATLLTGLAMDVPGNNTFNTIELGSCRGLLSYSSRMFAWGEQSKVTNFRNLSFDGGYAGVTIQGASTNVPLGWQLDANNGTGGSLLLSSPVFGWCYQISNTSGITRSPWGMLTQNAYQDEFGVPIITAATLYSVRIAMQAAGALISSGNLIVDLYSPSLGVALGSFSVPLNTLSLNMQIFTGTLLTTVLNPVPMDLQLRIWALNIPNLATINIDRIEPFPTLTPQNTLALKASYAGNQEAFDLVTGLCGPEQNTQPINGAMELFDLLYVLKERSWHSTADNGVTEPFKWNWKEVSNKVGTVGQNSYDWGEGWALTANRQGVFFFEGGEPIKVSQEIQPLWDLINWQYGYTIWLRNDPEQRRFTVGVPVVTPNPYMPEFPTNSNPSTPNVILMCNYRELQTGAALAQTGPIRSTYMGRLMSPEPARKWSFWNIACPYSDYISRANNNWPQFFCTGYGDSKIFQLLASQLSDDGNAINSFWISYGFVKPEAADAKGLGLFRMEFPYITLLATGTGNLNTFVYPESPSNPPYQLDPLPLPAVSQGDLELGVNIKGNRFFIRVGTNAVGSAFRLSKIVVPLLPDSWSPIRGYNAVTA